MISVRDIHKSYGKVRAVRGVGFALEPGRVTGLLGPNGAGKSTTIRIITGFLAPDSGSVEVSGHAGDPLATRRSLGYLPESAPAYPEMTPRSYLGYRARLYGLGRAARRQRVEFVLERCRIADVAGRRIGQLSKGYRQRVGLAAALVHDPPALILDEPTNGLDPEQIRETRSLVRELAEDKTVLVSSHILPEVERLCDRVIVIAGGKIRADAAVADLARGGRCVAEGDTHDPAWLAGVAASPVVERLDDRWSRFTFDADADRREAVARAAAGAGVTLRELRTDGPGLEAFFVRAIESGDEP